MRDTVLQVVKDFLAKYHHEGRPLLVGFSGGPDSLALLHLVLECRRFFRLELHVAHVDHGWREESAQEAALLQQQVMELGLPFYLHRLQGVVAKEEAAREARYAFFEQLYTQLGCQALVLGHQGDDQSETVLKRIFEGAGLVALGGIRAVMNRGEMEVWRPLLGLSKEVLQQWLARRGLKGLDDSTNRDPRYLRGRMREAIVPTLEKQFGKRVSTNLLRFGESAQELEEYFTRRLHKYHERVCEGRVDLSGLYPFEPLELKLFLKKFASSHGIFLSHAALNSLAMRLESGSHGRLVEVQGNFLAIKFA
jgi:tRNA(Ile)-lysidine synthase